MKGLVVLNQFPVLPGSRPVSATVPKEKTWPPYSTPLCMSSDCPIKKECRHHDSAGDFRSEGGVDGGIAFDFQARRWTCSRAERPSETPAEFAKRTFLAFAAETGVAKPLTPEEAGALLTIWEAAQQAVLTAQEHDAGPWEEPAGREEEGDDE